MNRQMIMCLFATSGRGKKTSVSQEGRSKRTLNKKGQGNLKKDNKHKEEVSKYKMKHTHAQNIISFVKV